MEHALTRYRQANNLNLAAFAAKIGASKGMVWKWERGTLPRKPWMEKICAETDGAVSPNDWYEIVEAAE
jgi:transcriptional regulator with XRE-family HTH domain